MMTMIRQKLLQKLKIIGLFYKNVVSYNLIFTAICVPCYRLAGLEAILPMFWIKFFGFALVAYMFYAFKARSLYFYYNLGFSLKRLLAIAIIIEAASYLLLIRAGLYFLKT
ncbi:hypothetical protein QQ020_09485 [Fulvivirgaceae bacterium BMA12]|uniref:Uncharacterized protein n=1 Tax=Agaribacillus aureus TaxID=3051825 RepID=A0ABT8L4U3_9BACT|nr:hypothetical protein [Fulvivirgaceae bacterium BMA12]